MTTARDGLTWWARFLYPRLRRIAGCCRGLENLGTSQGCRDLGIEELLTVGFQWWHLAATGLLVMWNLRRVGVGPRTSSGARAAPTVGPAPEPDSNCDPIHLSTLDPSTLQNETFPVSSQAGDNRPTSRGRCYACWPRNSEPETGRGALETPGAILINSLDFSHRGTITPSNMQNVSG